MPAHREKGDGDRDGDQDDDDPFKHFHAAGGRAVRHLAVDAFLRLQFAQNARIPCFKVETLGGEAIDARQVLVA